MTAFWAPHTVGGRPSCGIDAGPGTCLRGRRSAPVPGFLDSYTTTDLGGKIEKMNANPGIGGFNIGKINNLSYQSAGFPLTGCFVPACVGIWAWPSQKNCRRVVAVAVVGVIFLNARFSEEKLHKMMFVWRIEGVAMI